MALIGYASGETTLVGEVVDGVVTPVDEVSAFWRDPARPRRERPGPPTPVEGLELRPPVPPSARVVCVGLNYADHVGEGPFEPPEFPEYFGRWTRSLGTSGGSVRVPASEPGLDWEAELAVVVGRPLSDVDPALALAGVHGYAAFNDITARRAQHRGRQWTLGKNVDGSGVLGPVVPAAEAGDPADGWPVRAWVNGELVQSSTTDRLIFDVGSLLSDISRIFALQPGDVVATGTPAGVGHRRTPPWFLGDGDEVRVGVGALGSVSTRVVGAGRSPG